MLIDNINDIDKKYDKLSKEQLKLIEEE